LLKTVYRQSTKTCTNKYTHGYKYTTTLPNNNGTYTHSIIEDTP